MLHAAICTFVSIVFIIALIKYNRFLHRLDVFFGLVNTSGVLHIKMFARWLCDASYVNHSCPLHEA